MLMKIKQKRRRLNGLFALMAISLLGITGIQAYWLQNAYHLKAEKFDQEVAAAMQGVSRRMETLETIRLLNENFRMEPYFSSESNPLIGLKHNCDTSLRIRTPEGSLNVNLEKTSDDSVRISQSLGGVSGQVFISNGDSSFQVAFTDFSGMRQRFQRMDEVMNQMIARTFRPKKADLISQRDFDSILNFELKTHGLNLDYEYSIVENGRVIRASEQWDARQGQHLASLFPNDFFAKSQLLLSFPDKRSFLFKTLWGTFLVSLLFTAAIIFTFWKTISYSLRQKRISEIKTDFINNMTHEFKTPIATINLATDALKNPAVFGNPENIQRYGEVIRQENQRMNRQVESVLRMAMMDKKELELNFQETEIEGLLEDCISHIQLSLESRGGTLVKDFNINDLHLNIDRNHFSNAIINILENALKYSDEAPEIKVSGVIQNGELRIAIRDFGIGMNAEAQKRVFDRFFRAEGGNIHNVKGHGLGLSYALGVVQAHGGTIEVESQKGAGSTFTIRVPIQQNQN